MNAMLDQSGCERCGAVVPSHTLKLSLFPRFIIGPEKVPCINLASAVRNEDILRQAPDLSFILQYIESGLADRNSPLLLVLGLQELPDLLVRGRVAGFTEISPSPIVLDRMLFKQGRMFCTAPVLKPSAILNAMNSFMSLR
jgi:hypothetical protein